MKIYAYICTLTATALLVSLSLAAQSGPVGWASFGAGTTRGAGGDTTIITTRNQLAAFAGTDDPMVLMIQDTVELTLYERLDVQSNKTIVGIGTNAMLRFGGLEIKGDNVIVQNLSIGDTYDGDWSGVTHSTDALTIYGTNVWIDHCELFASADGLLDIRADNGVAADFVTVSYTRFGNHNKVMLIGSSNEETEDRGKLKTTIHHCWFDGTYERGLNQRMPRTRFGDIHIYNNYFEDIGSYCSAARFESDLVVEANYYRTSNDPHFRDDIGLGIADPELRAFDNVYELSSGRMESVGEAFEPSTFYDYTADHAEDVPALVMNEAGRFNSPDNVAPLAITDTLMLDGTGGLKIIDAIANDIDVDGGTLRIANIINEPKGITFVRDNTVLYGVPGQDIPRDSIWYQLVDTQGGIDTGLVLILGETSAVRPVVATPDVFRITPNPTDGRASVDVSGVHPALHNIVVKVFDSAGRQQDNIVEQVETAPDHASARISLLTSKLRSGVYSVVIHNGMEVYAERFVVMR
jgi:pectate lyase